MYKLLVLTMVLITLISCKEEKKKSSEDVKNIIAATQTTDVKEKIVLSNRGIENLEEIITVFKVCKEKVANRMDCRSNISSMISKFYNISDFNKDNEEYYIYDSIQPIVKRSTKWKLLGEANNQDVLIKAQEQANKGKATIAIDISQSYGQVAMIIPGEVLKSSSWKLKTPNTAVLVNYDATKSFYNKSLSYAFKSPKDIVIFTKK